MRAARAVLPVLAAAFVALSPAGCGDPVASGYPGYIEGEFAYLAAPQGGYLKSLDVARGERVGSAQPLFSIEAEPDAQAFAAALARVEAARRRVDNLRDPRRPAEIGALEARLRAAETALALSSSQLAQQQALAASRFISAARLDEARAARDRDAAELDAARQQLADSRASVGRRAEVAGAAAELQAANADAALREWQVARKSVAAPSGGEIADTYFQPGEWVPAGQPVASLLPDGRRRVRFFVPQSAVGALAPGQRVAVRCDGCGEPISARIDFIAAQSEYTPPVIYSGDARAKLVFRVEAVPDDGRAAALRPGLPVDVTLADR